MSKMLVVVLAGAFLASGSAGCGDHAVSRAGGMDAGAGSAGGADASGGAGGADAAAGTAGGSDAGGGQTSAVLPNGMCVRGAFKRAGACVCGEEVPTVCGDACVDLTGDGDNCGACAHACGPTAACVAGVCGATPVTIEPARTTCGDIDLAVANGTLVWTDSARGTVSAHILATGVSMILSSSETTPTRVAIVGTDVFWLDTARRAVRRNRAGATADLFTSATDVHGYVVSPDGTSVYYSTQQEIDRASVVGGAPVVVATIELGGEPDALALDGDTLAAAVNFNGFIDVVTLVPGAVARCDAMDANGNNTSVNCVRVGQGNGGLLNDVILLAQGHALWADYGFVYFSGSTTAYSKTPLTFTADDVSGLATTGCLVTFATSHSNRPMNGMIYKAPLADNQVAVPLARGQFAPRAVATDGKRVYWSTKDCAIWALAL